ncbi:flagellar hook-basal body complex protein, partial [Salmonella enterica]|uniref:flagellar hook-basal body complex protein n=1 Tax=Salmonella enterica TaxID=28901 RepID=UPI000CA9AF82
MIRIIDVVNRNFNVLQEKQKNLSANATNVNTPGFKYQSLIQSTLPRELAINHADGPRLDQRQELGEYAFGNQIDEAVIHMDEGDLQETGIPTDFAISGDGFFTVQGPEGELYTQNGRF